MGTTNKKEAMEETWRMVVNRVEERIAYSQNTNPEILKKNAKKLKLTRQYFDQNKIYFNNELKEIFGKLYTELQVSYSYTGEKGLIELFNLRDSFGEKIQQELEKKEGGSFPGVFIAARNIVNNGEIAADGPDYRTEIITDNYEGKGSVKASSSRSNKNFWEKRWFHIIILLAALATIISLFL